jgi:hypothetical protein
MIARLPIVGADGAIRKRWIADRKIKDLRQPGLRGVHLDAGQRQLALKRFRREGEEEAYPAARLQHPAAVEA